MAKKQNGADEGRGIRYATGKEIFNDLARKGPPSDIATRPRKKVIQPRRHLSEAYAPRKRGQAPGKGDL